MNSQEIKEAYLGLTPSSRGGLKSAAANVTYELFPSKYLSAEALSTLLPGSRVSVSCGPRYGLKGTLDLSETATDQGLVAVPHIPARMIPSKAEAEKLGNRLTDKGILDVFVVGGNNVEPSGQYTNAQELLADLLGLGYKFKTVRIAGYPEGYQQLNWGPFDPIKYLIEKYNLLKDHQADMCIVTQMCFKPAAISQWIGELRRIGIDSPISLGLPGACSLSKLARFLSEFGIDPANYLSFQAGEDLVYHPDRVLFDIFKNLDGTSSISGLHLSTFNELNSTADFVKALSGCLS